MIKILKKIDYVLLILVLLLILALYGVFQIKIQKHGYVNYFGYTFFQVITGSMEPTIKVKDLVIEKITKDVKIDDIVTYKFHNDYVTHRVIKQGGNYVVIVPNVAIWTKVITTPQVVATIVISLIIFRIIFYKDIKPKEKE